MSLKSIAIRQYRDAVDRTTSVARVLERPPEGWLRTARKALGMSGAQLARRIGTTRALVTSTELAELEDGVTLRNMRKLGEAMGYQFVYGLVPNESVDAMVRKRAIERATAQVALGNVHMALEDQMLSEEQRDREVRRLADELVRAASGRLWDDP